MGMPTEVDLPRRVACHFDLPLQVSSFFSLLILFEYINDDVVFLNMGDVCSKKLAHKLRRALPDIDIRCRNNVGYWLTPEARRELAVRFNLAA